MKKMLFVSLLAASFAGKAQSALTVQDTVRPFLKGNLPAYQVDIPETKGKEIDKTWSNYLKKLSKEKIIAAIESLTSGPRIIPGKFVFNLLPRQAPHKGMAVMELLNKTNTKYVFYIGDDDTDEDVFSLPSKNIFTVRVGKKKNSSARFYIERQSEINKLLRLIIGFYNENVINLNAGVKP